MPRFTVGGAVTEGIVKAGGVHSAEALGIHLEPRLVGGVTLGAERGISKGTFRSVKSAVSRMSKIRTGKTEATVVWNGEKLEKILELEFSKRIKLATQLVKDQVKLNLNRSVLKYKGPISKKIRVLPESRSRPGEFPRKETGDLQKNIFGETPRPDWGVVGTTYGYGLLLETQMNRSYLRRTLLEMQPKIRQILVKTVSL